MKRYELKKGEGERFVGDGQSYGPFVDGSTFYTGFIVGPEDKPKDHPVMQGCRFKTYRHRAEMRNGVIYV